MRYKTDFISCEGICWFRFPHINVGKLFSVSYFPQKKIPLNFLLHNIFADMARNPILMCGDKSNENKNNFAIWKLV